MSQSVINGLLLVIAIAAANAPWLYSRFLVVISPKGGIKREWMRLLEWLLLYFVVGFIALAMENKVTGATHSQGWDFYAITFFLFMVLAFPGFIWCHLIRHKPGKSPK